MEWTKILSPCTSRNDYSLVHSPVSLTTATGNSESLDLNMKWWRCSLLALWEFMIFALTNIKFSSLCYSNNTGNSEIITSLSRKIISLAFVTLWFFHLHHFLTSLLEQEDRQFWTNIFSLILVTSALASISPTYVATTTITGNSEVFSTLTEWTTIFSLRFEKSCLLQRHQFLPRPPLLQQQHRKVWSRKQTMEWTNIISLRFENLWLLQRHQFLLARLSLLQQQQQQEEILKL